MSGTGVKALLQNLLQGPLGIVLCKCLVVLVETICFHQFRVIEKKCYVEPTFEVHLD